MSQLSIPPLAQRQDAADRIGVPFWKLDDFRKRGLTPKRSRSAATTCSRSISSTRLSSD
jgi:hypothetical protein